jgi:hypothetical protein
VLLLFILFFNYYYLINNNPETIGRTIIKVSKNALDIDNVAISISLITSLTEGKTPSKSAKNLNIKTYPIRCQLNKILENDNLFSLNYLII